MLLPRINKNAFLFAITLPVVVIVLGIVYGHRRIINIQNKLISSAKNPIYVDSDDYWINGIFYKNPYDSRVVVEGRIGIKPVYNLATKKRKTYNLWWKYSCSSKCTSYYINDDIF